MIFPYFASSHQRLVHFNRSTIKLRISPRRPLGSHGKFDDHFAFHTLWDSCRWNGSGRSTNPVAKRPLTNYVGFDFLLGWGHQPQSPVRLSGCLVFGPSMLLLNQFSPTIMFLAVIALVLLTASHFSPPLVAWMSPYIRSSHRRISMLCCAWSKETRACIGFNFCQDYEIYNVRSNLYH